MRVRIGARQQDAEVRGATHLRERVDHTFGHGLDRIVESRNLPGESFQESFDRGDGGRTHQGVRAGEVAVDRLADHPEGLGHIGNADLRAGPVDQVDGSGHDPLRRLFVVGGRTPTPPTSTCHFALPRTVAWRRPDGNTADLGGGGPKRAPASGWDTYHTPDAFRVWS